MSRSPPGVIPGLMSTLTMQDQFTLNEKTTEEIVVLSDNYINLKPNTGKGYECYKVEI